MGWVLTADDHLIELDAALTRATRLGDEVPHGAAQPGILVGHGAPAGATPAQDMESHVPTPRELDELVRNISALGSRLSAGRHFASHFRDHKGLLETAMGTSYPSNPIGERAFLSDLGRLITMGQLKPIGIVTIKKGEPMVFVCQGMVGTSDLTAIVRPGGEWITLLASNTGMTRGLQYQMRFDSRFPFPFLQQRGAGFGRRFT